MRLLRKTIRGYILYSVFVLLVAIPVFYLAIKRIVKEDADEHLQTAKTILQPRITKAILDNTVTTLNFADPDIILLPSLNHTPSESFTNKEIYDSISGELVPYRILSDNFIVDGRPWLLQVRNSMLDSEDLIESIVKVQAILLLFLLAGLLLINRNLSRRIWRPFYTALDKLRQYKVDQHQPLDLVKSSINEFNDLNRSLDELTERVHTAYLNQKEFTENASHEMQTPLAIFQSKLELLMQTSPLDEEQAELIDDMANASQRMGKLNKSLILLTRIENLQFAETELILLAVILEKNIQQLQPQAEGKQITIRSDIQGNLLLEANRSLLEILVSNLLSNAIRHNFYAGTIEITLVKDRLIVANMGKPGSLDPKQIFRRFHKESVDAGSIGLGLEIVRQIGHLYGWTIEYAYKSGLHTFTVQF
jgi:signal transduction histidine kinase